MKLLALTLGLFAATAFAQDGAEPETRDRHYGEAVERDGSVIIDYKPSTEEETLDEPTYLQPIEQLLANPALITSLASNADAINRSVESVMDSLFYSLLDNERAFKLTEHSWILGSMKRDVYSAPSGSYVVVDRVALGPRYARELTRVHGMPISLGIDGTVEVAQIYLRNDGMRLAQQDALPTWRRWLNNWFGLVPLLSVGLPPSFNQNEMYDPLRQIETPFVFPLDAGSFYDMAIGSIRSYSVSGGVQVPVDFGGILDRSSRDLLLKIGNLSATVPYAVFKRGDYRINVLRRGEHSAWVGLKETSRAGHIVSPFVGSQYFLLKGALAATFFGWHWVWPGISVGVLPVNLALEQAFAKLYDQVYEYDLRKLPAREAYENAVRGDFLPSRERYLDAKEKGEDTGVTFHFTRTQQRLEEIVRNGPNFVVFKRERQGELNDSEIEITDVDGKFYVLETSRETNDKIADVLVGEEERRIQQAVAMKVRRVLEENPQDKDPDFSYVFDAGPDPIGLAVNLSIQDRYIDVGEYDDYIADLRFFSKLPLEDVPSLPLKDRELENAWRRRQFYAEPTQNIAVPHVPATHLGRFGAQTSMHFSTAAINRILEQPLGEKWRAFAKAFGADEVAWSSADKRASMGHSAQWFKAFLLFPLRLFNVRVAAADAIKETERAIGAMERVRLLESPRAKLDEFRILLDTDHPERLVRALLELAELDSVPRRVSFSVQPKGAARQAIRDAFRKLDGMIFTGGGDFPEPTRYARSKKKLANFYLDQPRDADSKPNVARVLVGTKPIPESVRNLSVDPEDGEEAGLDRTQEYVHLTISVSQVPPRSGVKLYVRVDQAGKIKIGKLALAEKVLELPSPDEAQTEVIQAKDGSMHSASLYEFFLSGPLSPLTSFMFDRSIKDGEELQVTLAVSADGNVWSDERVAEFRYTKGRLEPIK